MGTNEVEKFLEDNLEEFKSIESDPEYMNSFDFELVFTEFESRIAQNEELSIDQFSKLGLKKLENTVLKHSSKVQNGSSNNYLTQILMKRAMDESGLEPNEEGLKFKQRRNVDYQVNFSSKMV